LVKVKHAAMINLLAGEELVPELLQQSCTPERLATEIASLLGDTSLADAQRAGFAAALATLAIPGASTPSNAAAERVLELL
ncbi:MAG: lipid-A-disaccharide synthase, partial [Acidiphilium sp. 37-67-22]